ncbi:MAG: type II secretion system protein [bacterium]|nr:type II secretion system protein [bacterium]
MKAFTLAEVLITLAIIGVVAAISIPSVISNSQQQEFKTGLRKAVSVLNSAITMNMALDGETPYDNADTFNYLKRHMAVLKTVSRLPWSARYKGWDGSYYNSGKNGAFYTTDGMRFEFDDSRTASQTAKNLLKLHESDNTACFASIQIDFTQAQIEEGYASCGGCGSMGLKNNPNNTTKVPCAILVDVNGDRKPTPKKVYNSIAEAENEWENSTETYQIPKPDEKRVTDIFTILITDSGAIPYGITAQKAMYQAQK